MTIDIVALCIWREARSQRIVGMNAVASVIVNRAKRHKQTPNQVVMVPWAFSSMTAKNDPQLTLYPRDSDVQWATCLQLSDKITQNTLDDITRGATLYYDDSIAFPRSWNPERCEFTVKYGRLNFYKEI